MKDLLDYKEECLSIISVELVLENGEEYVELPKGADYIKFISDNYGNLEVIELIKRTALTKKERDERSKRYEQFIELRKEFE